MSKLKDWAMQRQFDLPRIETPLDCLEVGALWLLGRAREWCDRPAMHFAKSSSSQSQHDFVDGARKLLQHLEQLCGKEGK
jgi:hypothetical protein